MFTVLHAHSAAPANLQRRLYYEAHTNAQVLLFPVLLPQVEEDPILRRTPSPRVSQHPSVAALYQYAQEVCTPVSCNSKPVRSGTPPDCAELVSALEGAAHGVDTDATGDLAVA